MQKLHIAAQYFIAFAAGSLAVLSLPPFNIWPVLFLSFGLLFYQLTIFTEHHKTFLRQALLGWSFGFGYFAFGLYWIGNALLVEGNDYVWAWPFAVVGLPILLSFFTALASFICCRFYKLETINGFLACCGTFALCEWMRGNFFTGFPWNLYGYGWHSLDQIFQTLSIGGIYGLTLCTLLWCCLPGFIAKHLLQAGPYKNKAIIFMVLILLSFDAAFLYGHTRLQEPTLFDDSTDILIVQPDIPITDKWDTKKQPKIITTLASLSLPQSDKDTLIIWPETAISDSILSKPDLAFPIHNTLRKYAHDVHLLTGHLRYEGYGMDEERKIYNSLSVFDKSFFPVATYNKSHLVPFGEYIPFQNLIPLKTVTRFSGFKRGNGPENLAINSGIKISPIICYEVIFPKKIIKPTKKIPNIIVNVTNDAWYGNSTGPYQHYTKARARAVEYGIPVIRSANTGISGAIDAKGRTIQRLELGDKNSITLPLPYADAQKTFFAKWQNIPFLLLCIICILCGIRPIAAANYNPK